MPKALFLQRPPVTAARFRFLLRPLPPSPPAFSDGRRHPPSPPPSFCDDRRYRRRPLPVTAAFLAAPCFVLHVTAAASTAARAL
jgi:hypothetical protein